MQVSDSIQTRRVFSKGFCFVYFLLFLSVLLQCVIKQILCSSRFVVLFFPSQ